MTTIVTENCNGCRFTDCVTVCPVACFHSDEKMLYIDNDVCIQCSACIPLCPVHAIYADMDLPPEFTKDTEFNSVEANRIKDSGGEAITVKKDPLPTANERKAALGY